MIRDILVGALDASYNINIKSIYYIILILKVHSELFSIGWVIIKRDAIEIEGGN